MDDDPSGTAEAGKASATEPAAIRTQYDWSATTPSTAIAEVLGVASDREPTEIEPLYDVLDPDALDTLLADGSAETTVKFEAGGFHVTVTGDGVVIVE